MTMKNYKRGINVSTQTYRFALKDGTVLIGEVSDYHSKFDDFFIQIEKPRLLTALKMEDVEYDFDFGFDPIFESRSAELGDCFVPFIHINRDYVLHIIRVK